MFLQNTFAHDTLDSARRGDPTAIATLLTYHLSQRFHTTVSVIRLGTFLSVLIDTTLAADQPMLVELILDILHDLSIEAISTIEINARRIGSQEVLWSQTIELATHTSRLTMNSELTRSDLPTVDAALTAPSSTPISSTQDAGWEPDLPKLLQRPEMLALFAFALLILLWESYLDWAGEDDLSKPLTGVKLARRLGISNSTLSRHKQRSNFSEWSQDLDPNGIAWTYEAKGFVPQLEGLGSGE